MGAGFAVEAGFWCKSDYKLLEIDIGPVVCLGVRAAVFAAWTQAFGCRDYGGHVGFLSFLVAYLEDIRTASNAVRSLVVNAGLCVDLIKASR